MSWITSPSGAGSSARTAARRTVNGGVVDSGDRRARQGTTRVDSVVTDGAREAAAEGAVSLTDMVANARPVTHLPTRRLRTGRAHQRARSVVLATLADHQKELPEHSQSVATLTGAVARRLGFRSAEVREAIQTAEFHDVGKLALPDILLDKAESLDEQEWALMRLHTLAGEQILADLPAVADVGRLVRSTHERWDGQGYPDGLAGEEIPLASRIVFACDAFDAMTSDRAYQRPRSAAEALAELERCAGTQFDPRVVSAVVDELVSSGRAGGRLGVARGL